MLLKDDIKYMSSPLQLRNCIVYDNYDRDNSSTSAGNALTSQAWNNSICTSAKWGISDGKLYCSSNSSKSAVPTLYIDDGFIRKRITMDVLLNSSVSIIFRLNNASNFLLFSIQKDLIRIRKVISNKWSTIVSKGAAYKEGINYHIVIEDTGSTITIYINDELKLTVNDTNLNAYTKAGVRLGSATNLTPRFDNYIVQAF